MTDNPNNSGNCWFKSPNVAINPAQGKIGGRLWQDNGALAGVFEPGVETGVPGVAVRLLDAAGLNVLATTTSNIAGGYEFANLAPGIYQVEFDRPSGHRFTVQDATSDDLDSDPDASSGRVTVDVNDDYAENVDAGYFANTGPVAVDDFYAAHKNTSITGNVALNDTDANGDPLTVTLGSGPAHGLLTLNSDGSFTYTPSTNWTGVDSFTYYLSDGMGGTDSATVSITVSNSTAPVGANDSYSTPDGELYVPAAGVLSNDSSPNGGLTAVLASAPTHGTLTLNADGSFIYIADDSFVGTDTFTYRPTDSGGPGNLTTVSIAITNHPPVAVDDTATTDEDTPVTISVLANDSDPDNDPLSVIGASDGIYGTTVVNGDGTVTYTPDADWYGTDSFVYVIDDGYGRIAYGTVTVTVDAGNDPPVAVNDDVGTLQPGSPVSIDVLANDTDPDGDTLTVIGVTQGTYGAVTFTATGVTYYPPSFGHFEDTFTYTISDGNGGTDTATVHVNRLGIIIGHIWGDDDDDGSHDEGETDNLDGIVVKLLDEDDNVIGTTTTDSDGRYHFWNIDPGQYRIRIMGPGGEGINLPHYGSGPDSDIDEFGYSALLTVVPGSLFDIDAGLLLFILPPPTGGEN